MIYRAHSTPMFAGFCITTIDTRMKFHLELCNYNKRHAHMSYLLCSITVVHAVFVCSYIALLDSTSFSETGLCVVIESGTQQMTL